MGQSLINANKADFAVNPPRWSGFSVESEPIVITNTDPTQRSAWVSPSVKIISENGNLSKYFDYTTNPGSVTYMGPFPIIVEAIGFITQDSNTTGVESRVKWAKNGAPELDPTRYVYDKLGNQNTGVLLGISRNFELSYGDYLDFFFGCDTITTINMLKSEWKIKTLAIP